MVLVWSHAFWIIGRAFYRYTELNGDGKGGEESILSRDSEPLAKLNPTTVREKAMILLQES